MVDVFDSYYDREKKEIRSAKFQIENGEKPERKIGHWVEIGDEPYDEWECDVCGFVIDGSGCIDPLEYLKTYNFCPNCGAWMEKGEGNEKA